MAAGWKSSYYRYKELFLNVSAIYKKRADLRAFLEIVLSIIAIIAFLMFALKPTVMTIISLVNQISEEKQTLSSLTTKISNLQKANSLLADNQNYIEDINTAVSDAPNPDTFSKQIQGIATKDQVQILGLSINDIILIGKSKTNSSSNNTSNLLENSYGMEYSISIRGSFSNLTGFISDMEKMRMVSLIDGISISSSETDQGRAIVAVITGRVPYLENK